MRLSHLLLSCKSTSFESFSGNQAMVEPKTLEAMIVSHALKTEENVTFAREAIKTASSVNSDPSDPFTAYDTLTRRKYLKNKDLS